VCRFDLLTIGCQSTWIGFVITLASAQRTHVTTHAAGLLLRYALDVLGLRRVQWTCDAGNAPSRRAAERLGFRCEGKLRWAIVLPESSEVGDAPGADDEARGKGRHDQYLSVCWDEWESEGRELVEEQMARQS
jgi:RimJ/RimL family protein N-acetyltransferase